MLFNAVGMGIMVSATDLMTLYIGLEMSSLSSYVLASFLRQDDRSSEAGLKYFVLGALASGIILYGVSLVYGFTGSTNYDGIRAALDQARVARDRGTASVTAFADVGRAGVLSALSADARALADAQLRPLVDNDRTQGTALLATLRAWLDADCSHEACARALGVHRHTVRTRLAHIERVLGLDLGSFPVRAELYAALRAAEG